MSKFLLFFQYFDGNEVMKLKDYLDVKILQKH